jgi:hypothetical protein
MEQKDQEDVGKRIMLAEKAVSCLTREGSEKNWLISDTSDKLIRYSLRWV